MATNGTTTNGHHHATAPKITFYTNHGCPYAQRAHITLDELKLPYEEVIIDLETPRPQWYLDINPRGLVPSIKLEIDGKEEIITESAVVAQFLVEAYGGGRLLPQAKTPKDALDRARINFFVDTFGSKVSSNMFSVIMADSEDDRAAKTDVWFKAIEKELEPLLANASPFFNGSNELTFAEIIAGPFILRWYAIAEDGELISKSLLDRLETLPNFSKWAKATTSNATVKRVWSDAFVVNMKKMVAKRKAGAGKY